MITIYIKEAGGEYRSFTSSHRTQDHDEAISRAIAKAFGKSKFLFVDHGLTYSSGSDPNLIKYGQIATPHRLGGSSLESRVFVEVVAS